MNSVTSPPSSSSSTSSSRPPRRSLIALGIGVVIAALLGIGLFSAIGTNSAPSQASLGPAPGITTADANLLDLEVFPQHTAQLAPGFTMVDQHGKAVSLQSLQGKVVIWSLNDDRCTDLCTLFAQDVLAADHDLGPKLMRHVVFLSVNANPYYPTPASVLAWSERNHLANVPNWVYVTGSPAELKATWNAYHASVTLDPATRTVLHDALVEFIDPAGRTRAIGQFTNGSIDTSYYGHALAQMAVDLLPSGLRHTVAGPVLAAPKKAVATIGATAPAFSLAKLNGIGRQSLSSLKGKPTVINFWASNCSVCASEMPAFEAVFRAYRKKVNFVGIDVSDPRADALSFVRRSGINYELLSDPNGQIAAAYKVEGLPMTFFVGPNGTILARHPGALTAEQLRYVLNMDFFEG